MQRSEGLQGREKIAAHRKGFHTNRDVTVGISFRRSAIRDFSGYPAGAAQRGAAGPGKDRGAPGKECSRTAITMMGISLRGNAIRDFSGCPAGAAQRGLQGREKIAAPPEGDAHDLRSS